MTEPISEKGKAEAEARLRRDLPEYFNPPLTEEVLLNQLKRESTPLFGGFNARLDARMEAQKKANQEAYAARMAEERGDVD